MEVKQVHKKLGELPATAICGNDISSSCLYVSAITIVYAGQYAWISLLIVGAVLFLFRKIYGEVVGALPLNGGAYNALLNTTSKNVASLAASLTLLSYMATAVISAATAIYYVKELLPPLPVLFLGNYAFGPEIYLTICLLAVFLALSIIGIGESSKVAVGIFLFHLSSLVLLTAFCVYYLITHGFDVFSTNFHMPVKGGVVEALIFGFAAAMLGISGFESSANFVEEQERGVFPKTLRNMWVVVTIFNPLMAFLALAIVPIPEVQHYQDTLLSHMGKVSGGTWLSILITVDAALVLSGAVLTSYVGVTGLIERITLDRILPQFLLKRNKRGSTYRIPIIFFILSVSVLLITGGKVTALAVVYTLAFLSVMTLFGFGNVLLKINRKNLPRPERAPWISVFLAVAAVIIALIANAVLNIDYLMVFLYYFIPTFLIITIMLNRIIILRVLLRLIGYVFDPVRRFVLGSYKSINKLIDDINAQEFVFFTKADNVATLNKVMMYISKNEHTNKLKIVTVLKDGEEVDPRLVSDIEVLDREYPAIDIEFIQMKGKFGPGLIQSLSEKWNIPVNFMFIGSPGDRFPFRVEELGGVRLII